MWSVRTWPLNHLWNLQPIPQDFHTLHLILTYWLICAGWTSWSSVWLPSASPQAMMVRKRQQPCFTEEAARCRYYITKKCKSYCNLFHIPLHKKKGPPCLEFLFLFPFDSWKRCYRKGVGGMLGSLVNKSSCVFSRAANQPNPFHLTSSQQPPMRTQELGNEQPLGWGGGKASWQPGQSMWLVGEDVPGEEEASKATFGEDSPPRRAQYIDSQMSPLCDPSAATASQMQIHMNHLGIL